MAGESTGGRSTDAALEALPRDRWRVLDDVPWPGNERSTIDHVVVGRAGVFVIDGEAADAARAVARGMRLASCPVQPVFCLEGDLPIAIDRAGVLVCSTANLAQLIQDRREVLTETQFQLVAHDLAGHQLPRPPPRATVGRAATNGVAYLLCALLALGIALMLITRPNFATDAFEEIARWIAERIDDLG